MSFNRNVQVENNIFADYQIFRAGIGKWYQYTFRRNIVFYAQGPVLSYWDTRNDNFRFDDNLYWNTSGQPLMFSGKTFEEWKAAGQDRRSVVADPLFEDPEHGDFRLRPGSPALRVGFEPWDVSDVGPRSGL
ncbi:MAG TPA: hypothetical protein VFD71_01940 [Planctomycetota bacterium]|nr:hypothetical protein [Planctomycetota bacterium]